MLGDDAKIFGLVDREADRLRAAGNRIARGNAERALQAENMGEIIERLARRAGPVSDWLGDAARAVDAGMKPAEAADAFVARLRREIGEGGLAALEREAVPMQGLDDPGPTGTKPLADDMERGFDLMLKEMKAAQKAGEAGKVLPPSRDQAVMFAIRERREEAAAGAAMAGNDAVVGRSMRADLDALGFFSKALEAAKAWPQGKGTPEQALMWLKKSGVKDAEIEATNLRSMLEGKTSVTRDEIVKHLTENRVELNQKLYAGEAGYNSNPSIGRELLRRAESYAEPDRSEMVLTARALMGDTENRREPDTFSDYGSVLDEIQDIIESTPNRSAGTAGAAKWSGYSLDPENPTNRETVLHLPGVESDPRWIDLSKQIEANGAEQYRLGQSWHEADEATRAANDKRQNALFNEMRRLSDERDALEREIAAKQFQSGHFPEPNITGHTMTSMVWHEGKPVFLGDQIQSDWGQRLRDGGVQDEAKIAGLKRELDAIGGREVTDSPAWSAADEALVATGDFAPSTVGYDEIAHRLEQVAKDDYYDKSIRDQARKALSEFEAEQVTRARLIAELAQAESSAPGHPLVNTTDQWVNTTLRRALRQAAEADAEFFAIPHGDTVLSYNPGDTDGMIGFYGSRTSEGIVPKNLRKILEKLDKDSAKPVKVTELETPSGMKGYGKNGGSFDKHNTGFTLFPLTEKVKRAVIDDGQAMFARSSAGAVSAPEAQMQRAAVDAALLKGEFGYTARASADMDKIRSDVEGAVRRAAPRDVGIRFRDTIVEHGADVEGFFSPIDRMIHISLTAADPMRVGLEEAGHALKRAGLFTADEYRLLTDHAARHNLREAFDIEGRYADIYGKRWEGDKARVEAAMVEETVMQMLARHATGDRWGTPAEQTIVARLADQFWRVVNAVKEALGVRGINRVEDIFRAFEDGTLAARAPRMDDVTGGAFDPGHVSFARAQQQMDSIKDAADLVGACKR